jgi:hypothetical protein
MRIDCSFRLTLGLLGLVACWLPTQYAAAALVGIDVLERAAIEPAWTGGAAYEKSRGIMHFAVDPAAPANQRIADVRLAPRNADGLVEFSASFYLLRPTRNGNGSLLFEVSNRGSKGLMSMFDLGTGSLDPSSSEDFGDSYLLREGYTLLWVGWQLDVPQDAGMMWLEAPAATVDGTAAGNPVHGLVRSDFVVRAPTPFHTLADRAHRAYPVYAPDASINELTVREGADGSRRVIPRTQWRFARLDGTVEQPSRTDVLLDGGFEPHLIYELVYDGYDARVAGLGLAAIRDAVASLRNVGAPQLGIARGTIEHTLAFGLSQSGRLLRQYLYDGFNADEQDQRVFDGMLVHIAGGARGSFNHRFAQPSRSSASYFYPNELFPFADTSMTDTATARRGGLLTGIEARHQPRIFYTNSSNEYWRGSAALTHVSLDGAHDLSELPTVRRYLFAGTQHVPSGLPARSAGGQHPSNPNNYRWFLRGLLRALNAWIADDAEPPPSRHPRIDDGTLVPFTELAFPSVPGLPLPPSLRGPVALDFGEDFDTMRVIRQEPPRVGPAYPLLLPQVDTSGNEIAGLRSPVQQHALASYLGWVLYAPPAGPATELVSLQGAAVGLPRTAAAAAALGDPRPPIAQRYVDRNAYLGAVRTTAAALARARYLLADDVDAIVAEAEGHWREYADDDDDETSPR